MPSITRLRRIREDAGQTQAQAATAAGLSLHTILRAERGDRISPTSVALIGRAYGLKAAEVRAAMRDVIADFDPEPVPAEPTPTPTPTPTPAPAADPSSNGTSPTPTVDTIADKLRENLVTLPTGLTEGERRQVLGADRPADPAPLPPDTGPEVTIPGRVYRETIRVLRRVEKLLDLQDAIGGVKNGTEPRPCRLTTDVKATVYQLRTSRLDLPETSE